MSLQGLESAAKAALRHLHGARVVGLGSGSSVAQVVKAMNGLKKKDFSCVPTSLQIKIEAEQSGLTISEESLVPEIDVVFDGADQIDSDLNMIKGGGGALLREKILISAARKVVILASSSKFASKLDRPIPIEVHPMARSVLVQRLLKMGAKPELRILEKGYPFVTENGNIILDTSLGRIEDPAKSEIELKSMPGVMEAGIFTRRPDCCYRISSSSFEELT